MHPHGIIEKVLCPPASTFTITPAGLRKAGLLWFRWQGVGRQQDGGCGGAGRRAPRQDEPGSARSIFSGCDFNCSYQEILRTSPTERGVEIEIRRSRWEILKMLHNMKLWQRANVLHLSLVHYSNDFDATVKCMLTFFLEGRQKLVHGKKMQALLAAARAAGLRSKLYKKDLQQVLQVEEHLWMLALQEEHRFLADADALYDRLMIRGQKEMARLGCPDWKKWVPAVSRVLPWIASAVHCVGLELERPATLMRAFAQYSVVRQCDRGMF
ncbi:unnamed protein product [Durusdinium trenchii]|uniref:Uncharacterized protein n=1 Tax=Durusdinium trenchii TaxID=1381693 RepID=A0ABP0NU15_9DINO